MNGAWGVDEMTRTAAQAMYRFMRTADAFHTDPATRSDVEGLLIALEAAEDFPGHEVPVMANSLTLAAAETDAARLAANLSSDQLRAAVLELYPNAVVAEGLRCQAGTDDPEDCEGLEDAVLLLPASGPALTACVRHGAAILATMTDCRIEPGPAYRYRPDLLAVTDAKRRSHVLRGQLPEPHPGGE